MKPSASPTPRNLRYVCPECGHGGAHPDNLPAPKCDRCDYKVVMVLWGPNPKDTPRTNAVAKWQEPVTVDDYNKMVDHARALERDLNQRSETKEQRPSAELLTRAADLLAAEARATKESCQGNRSAWACADCNKDEDGRCQAQRSYERLANTADELRRFA